MPLSLTLPQKMGGNCKLGHLKVRIINKELYSPLWGS